MKKGTLVIGFLAVVLTGVWAQNDEQQKQSIVSIGFGGFAGGDLGGGMKVTESSSGTEMTGNMGHFGGGAFVFMDVRYAELSLGYFMGTGDWKMKNNVPSVPDQKWEDLYLSSINIGLLLKYPFGINKTLKLFPALGINYQAVVFAELINPNNTEITDILDHPGDLSAIWFQFGGGFDVSLSQRVYLRFEALYGFRPKNKMETDLIDDMKKVVSGTSVTVEEILGHGPNIKLAFGFNL
jgi:hypothetical protein